MTDEEAHAGNEYSHTSQQSKQAGETSVCTVLAFSVFQAFGAFQKFVRVSVGLSGFSTVRRMQQLMSIPLASVLNEMLSSDAI